ncbi:MAG: zf-HC2 domain-containing protein [Anaerolineales bacterium]|nr:MAG: zf-HC2 domain-containing protein [Anaerolineales bacterium]
MSNHVSEWLNAYLDGELTGGRLQQVEAHLAGCEACQTGLESLQALSALLHEVPTAEFTSNERFVSQVNLLLPQKQTAAPRRQLLEVGWWLIPVGLLMAWIFVGTTILVSDMVSAAHNFGLLDSGTTLLVSDPSTGMYWTSMLGQIGLLEGDSLHWAGRTERYTRNVVPQYIWQVSVALLYLTWIAIWWARHRRQGQVPLLGG